MKNNYVKIVSPEGISQYAWLTQPDTKFDTDGHYKVNLIVPIDKAQPLIKQINAEMEASLKIAKEKNKGKTIKLANPPYEEEMDEKNVPTGNIIFKFKRKAQIIAKDGKVIPFKVALFDSSGKPLIDTNVWSGSEMKVSAGLRAVQITKLVEGGSGNAEGYGFNNVKGGYTAPESANTNVVQEEKAEADF
jgi:hypothetical protein